MVMATALRFSAVQLQISIRQLMSKQLGKPGAMLELARYWAINAGPPGPIPGPDPGNRKSGADPWVRLADHARQAAFSVSATSIPPPAPGSFPPWAGRELPCDERLTIQIGNPALSPTQRMGRDSLGFNALVSQPVRYPASTRPACLSRRTRLDIKIERCRIPPASRSPRGGSSSCRQP